MKTTKTAARCSTSAASLIMVTMLAGIPLVACGEDDPPADTNSPVVPGGTATGASAAGQGSSSAMPTTPTPQTPTTPQTPVMPTAPAMTEQPTLETPAAPMPTEQDPTPSDGAGLGAGGDDGDPEAAGGAGGMSPMPEVPGAGGAGGGGPDVAAGGSDGMDMGMGGGMMMDDPPAGGGGGDPVPSAGCGKANPQTGSSGSPLNASNHNYYVKLPNGYDANTPYPVMIVFPPTGNPITWSEQSAGYEQAAPDAIRVYTHMSNQSSGWQPNETSFFQGLYDAITGNFCTDETRIFAGGESSGGEFAGFVGCEYGDIVRGVVPTAPKQTSWQINLGSQNCKGNPTAIVIWSPMDNVLAQPAGPDFRDFYRDMNMCDQASSPVEGWTDSMSNCEMFEGCIEGSNTYFCMHNDPEYSNTYHGWPHFAAEMTWQVFSAL